MPERQLRLEGALLLLSVVLLACAFPLQVLARSPLPALASYVILLLVFAIRVRREFQGFRGWRSVRTLVQPTPSDWGVLAYALIVLAHMVINLAGGAVGWVVLGANTFNFLFPLLFYLYFRLFADGGNVRAILIGVLVACALTGAYSVTHAYLKMRHTPIPGSAQSEIKSAEQLEIKAWTLFGAMQRYQLEAGDYSRHRVGGDEDFVKKTMRVGGPRSAGLLESNSISAAWIALGLFAALGLIPLRRQWLRYAILIPFMGLLIVFQYYTAIFAAMISFMLVMLDSGTDGMHRAWSRRKVYGMLALLALLIWVFLMSLDERYQINLRHMAWIQYKLLFGGGQAHYLNLVLDKLRGYGQYVSSFPWVILMGDGLGIYYPYSFSKGGDIGFAESLARLGIPLLLLVVGGGVRWARDFLLRGKPIVLEDGVKFDGLPSFAIGVIAFVALNDVHYSIWPAKSILPLLMIAFALCGARRRGKKH